VFVHENMPVFCSPGFGTQAPVGVARTVAVRVIEPMHRQRAQAAEAVSEPAP
jgi:hypothetical protein